MFENLPDWGWYVTLANLTRWFHWPAWSAIFSAVAIGSAIVLADRGNRDKRRREASMLKALIYPIATAQWWIPPQVKAVEEGTKTAKQALAELAKNDVWSDMAELLQTFKISEIPTTMAIDYYVAVLSDMRQFVQHNERIQLLSEETARKDLYRIAELYKGACKTLAKHAADLGGQTDVSDETGVAFWMKNHRA